MYVLIEIFISGRPWPTATNRRNSFGLNIEPCGTPDNIFEKLVIPYHIVLFVAVIQGMK